MSRRPAKIVPSEIYHGSALICIIDKTRLTCKWCVDREPVACITSPQIAVVRRSPTTAHPMTMDYNWSAICINEIVIREVNLCHNFIILDERGWDHFILVALSTIT